MGQSSNPNEFLRGFQCKCGSGWMEAGVDSVAWPDPSVVVVSGKWLSGIVIHGESREKEERVDGS